MSLISWISSSLVRNYPSTLKNQKQLPKIETFLNARFSFQVVMRMENEKRPQSVKVKVNGPSGWSIRVRRVGYVPVPHHNIPLQGSRSDIEGLGHIPGYVPDPLFEEDTVLLPPFETHSFWISVQPGHNARPGSYSIHVQVIPEQGPEKAYAIRVKLHNITLEKRKHFAVTNWFYADALIDWYKTNLFDRRFWNIFPCYVKNMVEHGQDTLYVPAFTPPLDGIKRPTQLVRVTRIAKDKYRFDWRDVRKYINLARRCGIQHFEWNHLFTQWGAVNAIRVYANQGQDEKLLWSPSISATSGTYRRFLAQYLSELHRFLSAENILKKSFFHVSDEPSGRHIDNYRKARALLKELAPWMKVMDALSDIEYGRRQLTDTPVASIIHAPDFIKEDIQCWAYYCCNPPGRKYLKRLLDTPLTTIAMHGFLLYRWPFKGFLHWGYNYWYQSQTRNLIDPYTVQDGMLWPLWPFGDTFMVYPGTDGPIDSIRWEIFGESLQDYSLLQTLGVERNNKMFSRIKNFADFPKTQQWLNKTKTELYSGKY